MESQLSGLTKIALNDERSFSIREFCVVENISHASYYKMRSSGNGPKEMRLPGSSIIRISPEARKEWHRRLERLTLTSAAVARDSERRVSKAKRAGKKGAASPAHNCRRVRG
jgi:hypothetical protein